MPEILCVDNVVNSNCRVEHDFHLTDAVDFYGDQQVNLTCVHVATAISLRWDRTAHEE